MRLRSYSKKAILSGSRTNRTFTSATPYRLTSSSRNSFRRSCSLTYRGAPMLICRALAPMIRAFSNLVWGRAGSTMILTYSGGLRPADLPVCHKAIGSPVGANSYSSLSEEEPKCEAFRASSAANIILKKEKLPNIKCNNERCSTNPFEAVRIYAPPTKTLSI